MREYLRREPGSTALDIDLPVEASQQYMDNVITIGILAEILQDDVAIMELS
jgi:hypothetical protein